MITREEAIKLLKERIKNKNLQKHCLAVEVAMRALANYFGEDEEKWGITGLLHDIDYEETKDSLEKHSRAGSEELKNMGMEEDICKAVLTHNPAHGIEPESLMGKALYCVDPLTGLMVASTLVLPSKKIGELEAHNVINRFKEKSFARGVDREVIAKCDEYLGLSLEKFIEIVLSSMQDISEELEL